MTEKIVNCPIEGKKPTSRCSLCLQLAENAFKMEMRDYDVPEEEIDNRLGESKLRALVEDESGITALSCATRRRLATHKGWKLGEDMADRRQEPGGSA